MFFYVLLIGCIYIIMFIFNFYLNIIFVMGFYSIFFVS